MSYNKFDMNIRGHDVYTNVHGHEVNGVLIVKVEFHACTKFLTCAELASGYIGSPLAL